MYDFIIAQTKISPNLKGHSTLFLKNGKKILKDKFTNMTQLQFLQLIRLRKPKRKNSSFPLTIQISAILFQVDCAINQFCKVLQFRNLLSTGILGATWVLKAEHQREIFPGGTETDAGPPKLSEALTNELKKVFTQIWSNFSPKIR